MMTMIVENRRDTTFGSCGGALVSVEGTSLPLRSAALGAEAAGGLARSVLRQTFYNDCPEPLEVLYTFPLPADGAVAAYEFRIGARRFRGRIDRREAARDRYERALIEGRTVGLVDQERDNLFTQRLGNVPPGTEVSVELHIDQKLRWLHDGQWEWRFPTVAAPRYLGGGGRVPDAARVGVEVAGHGTGIRASLDLLVRDVLRAGGAPRSPSHAIRIEPHPGAAPGADDGVARAGDPLHIVMADEDGAALDRDVVVRWPVERPESGAALLRARPGAGAPHGGHAYGLVTITPPVGAVETMARDLIILIDTSGSMAGRPVDLAKRVVVELIGSLGSGDRLEMIAFAMEPRRWRRDAVEATPEIRLQATAWVGGLAAGGGTEMTRAVVDALRPLGAGAQRQVVLVTDGQIGFEAEVLRAIRDRLPAGSRLHAVGVGPAVNCALLGPAARAGRGAEVIIDLDDDPAPAAARLITATRGPVLIDVVVEGAAVTGQAPRRLPDLLSGAPLLASVRLNPEGGPMTVRARSASGEWTRTLLVPPTAADEGPPAITALYGREAVSDLDLDRAAGADAAEVDAAIERIGLEFGLATRRTSWIAISEEPTVDPRRPAKVTRIPQELPYGLSAEGLGLGRARLADRASLVSYASVGEPSFLLRTIWPRQHTLECDEAVPPGATTANEARAGAAAATPGVPRWRFASGWVPWHQTGVHLLKFEIVGPGFEWRPESTAQLIMRSGRRIDVEVIASLTTVAGPVEPGNIVMLGLRLGGHDPAAILAVEIVSAGWLLRLDP